MFFNNNNTTKNKHFNKISLLIFFLILCKNITKRMVKRTKSLADLYCTYQVIYKIQQKHYKIQDIPITYQ